MPAHTYICIDLKSFYASVECVDRGLDPMTANLVVADPERTEKTICLAITPAMKKLGIKNRCRVFQIPKNVDYVMAVPRMQRYIDVSAQIYSIYTRFISPEDIHVYSIDEAFMDVTCYMKLYEKSAPEIGKMLMDEVFKETKIRATCGVGTNLYLAKIALDITAKHSPDFIGILDEETYCKTLWNHRPLTDFWRIGKGTAARLAKYGIFTMRGIAEADEDLLYKVFGVDAELLIDHSKGRETVTIEDIKKYRPATNCLSSGQVLMRDYSFAEARIIVGEMMEQLCLDMVKKGLTTESVTLYAGYSNKLNMAGCSGTTSFAVPTNTDIIIVPAVLKLFDEIADRECPVRRINIGCNRVNKKDEQQLDMFSDEDAIKQADRIQETALAIKEKFGKNAVFKGVDLTEAATALERNRQIGGHKSGE